MTLKNTFNAEAFWSRLPDPANKKARWWAEIKEDVVYNINKGNITIDDFIEKYPGTSREEVQGWIDVVAKYAKKPGDSTPLRATTAQSYPTRKNDI